MVKQTGFLWKEDPKDYRLGSSPIVWEVKKENADWIKGKPDDEAQFLKFKFDSMSCTSFSADNDLETYFNEFLSTFSKEFQDFIKKEGYIVDGKLNFSDRFTAIMSGTTPQGNYFQNVWDSIRTNGLIPEADLPFGGKTWAEYHDKSKITPAMIAKGKKFANFLNINYEFVLVTDENLLKSLKYSPLHVAIPIPATHAVELINVNNFFDTYPPYLVKRDKPIGYALRFKVEEKIPKPTYKYFKDSEVVGLKPKLVEMLDKARELAGIPFVITSGYRTLEHNEEVDGVKDSAHTLGLAVDLRARNSTEHYLITKALMDVGFKRISRKYSSHVHCDIDENKPQNVLF